MPDQNERHAAGSCIRGASWTSMVQCAGQSLKRQKISDGSVWAGFSNQPKTRPRLISFLIQCVIFAYGWVLELGGFSYTCMRSLLFNFFIFVSRVRAYAEKPAHFAETRPNAFDTETYRHGWAPIFGKPGRVPVCLPPHEVESRCLSRKPHQIMLEDFWRLNPSALRERPNVTTDKGNLFCCAAHAK